MLIESTGVGSTPLPHRYCFLLKICYEKYLAHSTNPSIARRVQT